MFWYDPDLSTTDIERQVEAETERHSATCTSTQMQPSREIHGLHLRIRVVQFHTWECLDVVRHQIHTPASGQLI